jgi:truncated hemoglobin YjbI/ankyrin repeat protein
VKPDSTSTSTLYDTLVGDAAACRRLSAAFYARVARDPILRPFFPGKTMTCAIEEFAAFLTQFLGGPAEHTQRRWWISLRESHSRFALGPRERDAWMKNMRQALAEADIPEPARGALRRFFEESSAYVVNQTTNEAPAPTPADVEAQSLDTELARCWSAQRALDETIAAIRTGDTDRTKALLACEPLAAYLNERQAVQAAVLAEMINRRTPEMLAYVQHTLSRTPALAREQYNGRTLLHEAAINANTALVELLLKLGAEPKAGVHTPLYSVGNECQTPGITPVITALVKAGADINSSEGPKQSTPLHMAARRDNAEVATALLDHGANIEARDSNGDTPLRRAVNCNQPNVAAVLVARGADPHSRGSRGLTPTLAARGAAMKEILASTVRTRGR